GARRGGGLADDLDVALGLEQVLHASSDDLVVVDEEHADVASHGARLWRTGDVVRSRIGGDGPRILRTAHHIVRTGYSARRCRRATGAIGALARRWSRRSSMSRFVSRPGAPAAPRTRSSACSRVSLAPTLRRYSVSVGPKPRSTTCAVK